MTENHATNHATNLDTLKTNHEILILGGTGKTGRRIAARLPGARVGSRAGTPPFDWTDQATWAPALAGTRAAYLAYYPDVTAPWASDVLGALAERAARAGVERLVLLSARGLPNARPAERAVREAGTGWTILRASWFCQNFSEEFPAAGIRERGELVLPAAPDTVEAFVDADDIADVAVAALTGGGLDGRTLELTSPRALTLAESVAELGRATGREIRYRAVSAGAYAAHLTADVGLPTEVAGMLAALFEEALDGRNAAVTGDVAAVLGRPARDFADFAAATATAWRASPTPA
ncbi:NmrA family transcriptional regulator [Streptomyces hainanensis]|uniref:NmrA family transcriptional regulator n=1 Tax=Streptomyces hainanensis TaxID=402648 RepID=A0A4R4SZJ9_9ACTN|nr:NmrA family transcriptional regulator [Streptomyces hainanensis]TDC69830.1 NmrA family transcriptional regulator [Streptomyces hainanensis]